MKNSFIVLIVSVILVSCAHQKQYDGTHRLSDMDLSNNLPNYILPTELFDKGRSIASVSTNKPTDAPKVSLKNLYFNAMLGQYRQFTAFYNARTINSCPAFHNDFIQQTFKIDDSRVVNISSIKFQKPEYEPLLVLKLNNVESLIDYYNKNGVNDIDLALKSALVKHAEMIKSEVVELCETGTSENYYRFHNFYRSEKYTHLSNKSYLKGLLKIPVFSNMLLLEDLFQKSGIHYKKDSYTSMILDYSNRKELFLSYLNKVKSI